MIILETKKVFISYSWSNEEHKQKVLDLAKSLVHSGIEVVLDVWDLKVGQDKFDFMEQMIKDSSVNRVLIISDKMYSKKADDRQGGVGTETQIITPAMYDDLGKNRFIPIIFERNEETGEEYLPLYAKGRMYIDLSSEAAYQEGFEKLLREIYEKPDLKKPKLGKIPSFLLEEGMDTFEIERKADLIELALDKNSQRLSFAVKDYFDFFISELDKLTVKKIDEEVPDEAAVRMIRESIPFRRSFVKVVNILVQDQQISNLFVIDFFTDFNNSIYQIERKVDSLGAEAIRFLLTELFILMNSIFCTFKRWDLMSSVINHKYYDENNYKEVSFITFRHPTQFIFDGKLEKEGKRVSLTADIMKERANEREFMNMIEMDLFLYYVSKINPNIVEGMFSSWFPLTYIYMNERNQRLGIIKLLKSKQSLLNILPLFALNEEDLKIQIPKAEGGQGYRNTWGGIPSIENFIKKDEIGSMP